MENIQQYKTKLLEEKKELEAELADLGIKDPESGDWGAVPYDVNEVEKSDANDMADRYEEFGEQAYTLGELEKRYRYVQQALTRIETDGYGTCSVCEKEIEKERLAVDPAATTCIEHREAGHTE